MNPFISVIIPTYNRDKFLPRAIQSIENQTYKDWELIIVDDCSTDSTKDIVFELQKKDLRIKYIRTPKNGGGNAARNLGIKIATAPILSFLDSDDEMHPNNLEGQFTIFNANPNLGLSYVGGNYFCGEKNILTVHPKKRGYLETFLYTNLKGLGASTTGFAVKSEVFKKVGEFEEIMSSQQDLEFLVRVARYYEIDYLDDANTKIHIDSINRISDNYKSVIQGEVQFFEKHKERIKELGLYHHVVRKLARKYAIYQKNLPMAYKCIFEAIKFKPSYLYAYIYALKLPFLYFKGKP